MCNKVCLTMLMIGFLHVASAQTAENPSINDDAEPNTKEIEIKEFDVLGVFDRMRFETVNVASETRKKPILRLASSTESTLERQPWRSIEDPERAGVFPFQPVRLNPLQRTNPLQEGLMISLTADEHECWPLDHGAPKRSGSVVETYFASTCSHPDGQDYRWILELNLFGPTSSVRTKWVEVGNPFEFLKSVHKTQLTCVSGTWRSHVKLSYRLDAFLSKTRTIYNNSRSASVSCP